MKVFIGLGNPGGKYKKTRHNFGFVLLDKLSCELKANFEYVKKFDAEIAEKELGGQKLFLVKPMTFMNNSGEPIKKFVEYHKIDKKDLVVIYDDIDLDFGTVKTTGSSSAGHRGMESIIKRLNSNKLARYRLGINNSDRGDIPTEAFVLKKFEDSETKEKERVIDRVIQNILIDFKLKK